MTAHLTFTAIKNKTLTLDQTIPVSPKAWKVPAPRCSSSPKPPVTVDEPIHGMIIQSGNDACGLGRSHRRLRRSLRPMMNKEAARLGLKNTHFENSTGLPHPSHLTTVRDLSLLATAIIRDFPEFCPIYHQGIRLQQDQTAQPQPPAVLSDRRRRQDRPHRQRRLLPDRLGQTQRPPSAVGGRRHHQRQRARPGIPKAAQLGLSGLRHRQVMPPTRRSMSSASGRAAETPSRPAS